MATQPQGFTTAAAYERQHRRLAGDFAAFLAAATAGVLSGQPKVALDRHADPSREALLVALHLPDRLVEEDPLDTEERHEHGAQPERLVAAADCLGHPVVEARQADSSQVDAGHRQLLQHAPELLGGIGEMDDDDRSGADRYGSPLPCSRAPAAPAAPAAGCDSSTSTPPALFGCTNWIQQPPAPRVGSGRSTW